MPRKRFDKSTSTTYQLRHRPQNDPLIHDGSSLVFQEVAPTQSRKIRNRRELEDELFGSELSSVTSDAPSLVRDNEGEAAEHGVYYDDTEYDYMQHMRELGSQSDNGASAVWISAEQGKGKQKQKQSLADALAALDLEHEKEQAIKMGKLVEQTSSAIGGVHRTAYEQQQDVPDELRGFQPDMNPRLREVLEALDDEAYVDDDEDGDFFAEIANGGEEVSLDEFEDGLYYGADDWQDEDDEGWESDRTIKAKDAAPLATTDDPIQAAQSDSSAKESILSDDGEFMSSFRNLPNSIKKPISSAIQSGPAASLFSAAPSSSLLSGMKKRKKRKGALTDPSSFSMTSSSIARSEGLQTLDARFDKILESYAEDDEGGEYDDSMSMASGVTSLSKASGISRTSQLSRMSGSSNMSRSSNMSALMDLESFNSVMDDFLGSHEIKGRRRVRKGDRKTGMQELDEIRDALGRREEVAAAANTVGASVA